MVPMTQLKKNQPANIEMINLYIDSFVLFIICKVETSKIITVMLIYFAEIATISSICTQLHCI